MSNYKKHYIAFIMAIAAPFALSDKFPFKVLYNHDGYMTACVHPWRQSKIYPDHYEWFMKRTGKNPSSYGRYIMDGGDMVQVFVDTCREHNLMPMITLRLKDEHTLDQIDNEVVSRFYYENQHLRLDMRPGAVFGYRGLSWMYPEVLADRIAIIRELCENYDIDGIELDFMR